MNGFDEAKYYKSEAFGIGLGQSDQQIREKISEAYSRNYNLAMADINIEVSDGFVTLTGTVQGYQEKKEASDLISNLSGIKAVKNDLEF